MLRITVPFKRSKIFSTSPPGGNQVDGLPPASSIEKFEKSDHSRDSPIVFPYTYGYRGAAYSTPMAWGPFFESKKHIALTGT